MSVSVMGVLNVTPDSFSDGGRFVAVDDAVAHGRRLLDEGADILDIGGESTRPGAHPVDPAVEIDRTVPVIAALAAEGLGNFDELSQDDLQEVFIGVVARSIEQAGAGRTLRKGDPAEAIAPVLASLLADGPHRVEAARLGAQVRGLPGAALGADALEAAAAVPA